MDAIDWKAAARLQRAGDAGAAGPGQGGREGTLRELVHHVSLLSPEHRQGIVIEVADGRTLAVDDILELAAREDLGD